MLKDCLSAMKSRRLLVVGDAMLDRYWFGGVERISPEAPVPVIAVDRSEERPGGAANVATNIAGLGSAATLISASGDDSAADLLERLVHEAGVTCALIRDPLVNTTVKLRIVSRNQQLIRIDFETQVSPDTARRLLQGYATALGEADAVVISDYGKGGLARVAEMIRMARERGRHVLVDPKGTDYTAYHGATVLTPNRREFEQVAGRFYNDRELEDKARAMIAALDVRALLVTRSEEGMTLIERDGPLHHVPTRAREVYDVTGAGDTVIATVAAALAAGAAIIDAVKIANAAAGLVVAKQGAVAINGSELEQEL